MAKRSFTKFVARLEKIKLREEIEKRALRAHVSLQELYEGEGRTPSIGAARQAIYTWLADERQGFGLNEIARLFDRAPNGVRKLVRKGA